MKTVTFTHENKDYQITIKRENIGTAPIVPDWLITAVDSTNAQWANVRIKDSVLKFLVASQGTSEVDLLVGVAQNEIRLNVAAGIHS